MRNPPHELSPTGVSDNSGNPPSAGAVTVPARSIGPGGWTTGESAVPCEEPVTLMINGVELVTLLASPGERLALAVGFLFNEGIVDRVEQIEALEEDDTGVRVQARGVDVALRLFERRVLGSGCGRAFFGNALDAFAAGGRRLPAERPWVASSAVAAAAATAYGAGGLYQRTRGTHAAALFDRQGALVALAEDIGRHSAVDKVIGRLLLQGRPLDHLFMVVTGRVSSEMVGKIAKTPIPLLVSKSVPTDLALNYAERMALCVVGRVAGGRMRVYTYPELVDPAA